MVLLLLRDMIGDDNDMATGSRGLKVTELSMLFNGELEWTILQRLGYLSKFCSSIICTDNITLDQYVIQKEKLLLFAIKSNLDPSNLIEISI